MTEENSIITALLANLPHEGSALANARAEADKWQATARRYQQLYESLLAALTSPTNTKTNVTQGETDESVLRIGCGNDAPPSRL